MEDEILAYLEQYGQPQSIAAISENITYEVEAGELEATLVAMAKSGVIQEVNAGVHSGGNPTVEYAPVSFEP